MTTRNGTLIFTAARHVPRRLLNVVVTGATRRQGKAGRIDEDGIAGALARTLRGA